MKRPKVSPGKRETLDYLEEQVLDHLLKFQPSLAGALFDEGGEEQLLATVRGRVCDYRGWIQRATENGLQDYEANELYRYVIFPAPVGDD